MTRVAIIGLMDAREVDTIPVLCEERIFAWYSVAKPE